MNQPHTSGKADKGAGPAQTYYRQVLDRLVHCFGKIIWVIDEESGKILGQGTVDHEIEQSLVGEDGHLHCVGEGYAMSFELPSCKQRWKTFFSKKDVLLREVKAMTGPRYGMSILNRLRSVILRS